MDAPNTEIPSPGPRIRDFRNARGWSLDKLADLIHEEGVERPSTAKLSRIETEIQPVALDILPALAKITEIPRDELRPDLAAVLQEAS